MSTDIVVSAEDGVYHLNGGDTQQYYGAGTYNFVIPEMHEMRLDAASGQDCTVWTGTPGKFADSKLDGTKRYYWGSWTVQTLGTPECQGLSLSCFRHGEMGGRNRLVFDDSCSTHASPPAASPPPVASPPPIASPPPVSSCSSSSSDIIYSDNAQISASSNTAGVGVIKADNGQRWSAATNSNGEYVNFDLGASVAVCTVYISWEKASAKKYEIQTSDDQVTYTTQLTYTFPGSFGAKHW